MPVLLMSVASYSSTHVLVLVVFAVKLLVVKLLTVLAKVVFKRSTVAFTSSLAIVAFIVAFPELVGTGVVPMLKS